MKKLVTIGLCLAAAAAAQTKVSGTGKCGQPEKQESIEVGDRPGHMLLIVKQACTWTEEFEMAGVKGKSYVGSIVSDISGQKAMDRGYVVVTMENGDKAFVRINQGTSTMSKDGKPVSGEGTWSYTGGTGKFKGITGKGTYKSKPVEDGVEDVIEGEYSLPSVK
jgi:hypothetical protein